ncbi:L7Ae/L30e/S12e/Gadd45 family ribosomal protein [Novisyntrophococcus fermenticellae]|uniref:L7Ae/L30e/S12e/Gadd45 family ribosomal protein n=1 Tax=Novisyntrophococcus fermenticellae TaxID=2068655 RepID=UPI001E378BC3|nr:ribosomal L7Ae/L30e/S12e/Gadd45 family protein [Novisyntrophococcus fermenticellae]
MNDKRIYSFLGLAMKGGKIASGEFQVEHAVKSGTAALVIVTEDASENTRKKFGNMCEYYRTPICYFGKMEELGTAIGKAFRASLAVTDENMAKAIAKQMNE